MKARLRLVLALLAASGAPSPAGADELGRLFFTPAERAELDARRRARLPDKPPAAEAPAPPRLRVHGLVQRSDGRSIVWVDGRPWLAGEDGAPFTVHGGEPSRLAVTLEGRSGAVEVGIGATVERDSGRVRDLLGDGQASRAR